MKCNPWVGGSIGRRGIPMLGTGKRGLSTYVRELFANNEQGFFYDPNDLSTMFRDAAGTIPVTDVGQPVGLILDKSKGLAVNELIRDVNFDNPANWLIQPSGTTAVTIANGVLSFNAVTNYRAIQASTNTVANKSYTITVEVSSYVRGDPFLLVGGVEVNIPKSVGKHTLKVFATSNASIITIYAGKFGVGGEWSATSISIKEIAGNHAYQTTSASRPILRQNAVTGAYYLEFDGSDDCLQTANIDFTATDKVSLFAGVRKLSDSTNGILLELSASITTNSGVFCAFAPRFTGGAGNFGLISKGTVITEVSSPAILAPVSAVISVKSSILASVLSMRVNGALSASSNNSQGTGNFGNYPLFIGRRGGTSLPFNGHIYNLIGVGRLTTEGEIAAIEKELAKRTGVTLSV